MLWKVSKAGPGMMYIRLLLQIASTYIMYVILSSLLILMIIIIILLYNTKHTQRPKAFREVTLSLSRSGYA
jgi:type IV secretory pathway VirB3-like protein